MITPRQKPRLTCFRQRRRADIEPQMYGRGDLVHMLAAGPLGRMAENSISASGMAMDGEI